MQKYLFISIIAILITLLANTSSAHQSTVIPFELNIAKNTSLAWPQDYRLSVNSTFNYMECIHECGCDEWKDWVTLIQLNLYKGDELQKNVRLGGWDDSNMWGKWFWYDPFMTPALNEFGVMRAKKTMETNYTSHGVNIYLEQITADRIEAVRGDCGNGPAASRIEVIQPNKFITIDATKNKHVETLAEPIDLGVIGSDLAPGIAITAPNTQILDESIQISSSIDDVMVWFGTADWKTGSRTTKNLGDTVYACADLDRNRKCDYDQAKSCLENEGDWYNAPGKPEQGFCCKVDSPEMCKHNTEFNVYCGKTPGDNPTAQLATPNEIGLIHDFTGCESKIQVVFDESNVLKPCKKDNDWDATIKTHDYNCNATLPKITECGTDKPISQQDFALKTGENITVRNKATYCTKANKFTTDLDGEDADTCESEYAGQKWTGTRCCSEADDRKETAGQNEYYSNTPTTETINIGGCWNSTFIPKGEFAKNFTNNSKDDTSIINYKGIFTGCNITDQLLLSAKNTNTHGTVSTGELLPGSPGIPGTGMGMSSPFGTQQQTTGTQTPSGTDIPLITNKDSCGQALENAVENSYTPHAICQPWREWVLSESNDDTVLKTNPLGEDQTTMPKKFKCDQSFKIKGCCPATKCWDGKECKNTGEFIDGVTKGFMCDNGNWVERDKKTSFDKTEEGFCARTEQCLVYLREDANAARDDDQPTKFFTGTKREEKPRCITNKQYLKDEYCDNGKWTTRTKLLAMQLLSLAETISPNNYDLFCDNYKNTLNKVQYDSGKGIVENFIKEGICLKENTDKRVPCTNNFCILKTPQGVAAIATSLNAKIDKETSFLKAINADKNFCDNTATQTGFNKCSPSTPLQKGQVWYNPETESIIFIPNSITTNTQDTYTQPHLNAILNYAVSQRNSANPSTQFDFLDKTGLFSQLMFSKQAQRGIFAVLEKQPTIGAKDAKYYLGIKYTGFSLGTEPCLMLQNSFDSKAICQKQLGEYDFVLLSRDLSDTTKLAKWKDLTSKLRLMPGQPNKITTDIRTEPVQPETQQAAEQTC